MAGSRRARAAGDRALPAAAAALHPEHRHDRNQGMRRGRHDTLSSSPRPRAGAGARRSPAQRERRRTLRALRARTRGARSTMMLDPEHGPRRDNVIGRRARARLHVADQHRHLPLEHARRPRPRRDLQRAGARADRADAGDASRRSSATTQRPVLQLVRPADRREADDLAGRRQHGLPVPLERRQRLARRGAGDGRSAASRSTRARRARSTSVDGLRLLLRPRPRPDPRRRLAGRRRPAAASTTRRRTSTSRATTTARSTPSRGSRATSASPGRDPADALLQDVAHASRTTCDWSGRSRSRRASRAPTSASTSSRATTPTPA